MKKLMVLTALLLILPVFVSAQNFNGDKENITIADPDKALKIGEKLEYSVEWLGVPVGKIMLFIEGEKNINGHDCYYVTARAGPNKYLSKITLLYISKYLLIIFIINFTMI